MMDERRESQASLYVLGALPEDEVREFEVALRSDLQLQLLVRELRDATAAMVAAFPRETPPPGLRARVLAMDTTPVVVAPVRTEGTPWFVWMPWALAACFAILCLVLLSLGFNFRSNTVALNREI